MQTTFDLPADLIDRAKVIAARRKTTLKKLILQGLEDVTIHEHPRPKPDRKASPRQLIAALQATNTEPMQPLKRARFQAADSFRSVEIFPHPPM